MKFGGAQRAQRGLSMRSIFFFCHRLKRSAFLCVFDSFFFFFFILLHPIIADACTEEIEE